MSKVHSILRLKNISLTIGESLILDNISLNVNPSEIVTLLGPNGAGKSSLLKIILGLIKPTSGSICMSDNLKIGYMPQQLIIEKLMPLSVERFLKAGGEYDYSTIERLKLQKILKRDIHNLSGGEMQRVLLARALTNAPHLLVLDEPVQQADVTGQLELYQLILDVRAALQCTIIMVSHDLHLVMANTDKVVCINKHICCAGRPQDIHDDPKFINLFGKQAVNNIALYIHKHDHKHDL